MTMLTGSRLWFCKIILEAACEKLILLHFPCSLWEVGTIEHRPITEKGIQRGVSVSIFKLSTVSYFKEANKNLYRVVKSCSASIESTEKNVETFKKIAISWHSPFNLSFHSHFSILVFLCFSPCFPLYEPPPPSTPPHTIQLPLGAVLRKEIVDTPLNKMMTGCAMYSMYVCACILCRGGEVTLILPNLPPRKGKYAINASPYRGG